MDPINAVEQNLNGTTVRVHHKSELLNWPAKNQYRNPKEGIEANLSESETAEDLSNWISLGTGKFRSQVANIVDEAITDGWVAVVTEKQDDWSAPSVQVKLLAPGSTVLAMAAEIVSRPDWTRHHTPIIGFSFEWTAESHSSDRLLWNRRTVECLRLNVNKDSDVPTLGIGSVQMGDWKGNHREAGWRTDVKPQVLRHRPAAALELVVNKAAEHDALVSERDSYDRDTPARKALRESLEWTKKSAQHDVQSHTERAQRDVERMIDGYSRDPREHVEKVRKAQKLIAAIDAVFSVEGETHGEDNFITLEKAVLQSAMGSLHRSPEVAAVLLPLLPKVETPSLS